jgi:hypothetical protein
MERVHSAPTLVALLGRGQSLRADIDPARFLRQLVRDGGIRRIESIPELQPIAWKWTGVCLYPPHDTHQWLAGPPLDRRD